MQITSTHDSWDYFLFLQAPLGQSISLSLIAGQPVGVAARWWKGIFCRVFGLCRVDGAHHCYVRSGVDTYGSMYSTHDIAVKWWYHASCILECQVNIKRCCKCWIFIAGMVCVAWELSKIYVENFESTTATAAGLGPILKMKIAITAYLSERPGVSRNFTRVVLAPKRTDEGSFSFWEWRAVCCWTDLVHFGGYDQHTAMNDLF